MQLTRIDILKYKSIKNPVSIYFNEGKVVTLIGKNGSGKTNVLEAIKYAMSKNHFYGRDKIDCGIKYHFELTDDELDEYFSCVQTEQKSKEIIVDFNGNNLEQRFVSSSTIWLEAESFKTRLDVVLSNFETAARKYIKALQGIETEPNYFGNYLDVKVEEENRGNEETRRFCNKHVFFKDSILDIRKNGACGVKKYINLRNGIKEEIVNNIFQRLCPEITIPRKYFLNNNESVKTNNAAIDYSDRAVIAYRLENSQINIINKIKKGDQLVLACAGSGKSVLLISKCFKLASLNPNEKFLITCYNRNLKSYYEWAIAQAGFMSNTVKCQTFYGLCYGLLESNHLVKPSQGSNPEEYYEALFLAANEKAAKAYFISSLVPLGTQVLCSILTVALLFPLLEKLLMQTFKIRKESIKMLNKDKI